MALWTQLGRTTVDCLEARTLRDKAMAEWPGFAMQATNRYRDSLKARRIARDAYLRHREEDHGEPEANLRAQWAGV